MRAWIVMLALAASTMAGCVGNGDVPGSTEDDRLALGWRLDCSIADHNDLSNPQDCLRRASQNPGSKNEMWVAVNPTDPDNVVVAAKDMDPRLSNDCVWNGYAVTHDGGATWTDVAIGGDYADRQPGDPWFGYACNTDPMIQFAEDGRLYAVLDLYGLGASPHGAVAVSARMQLVWSDDGGLTWDPGQMLLLGDSYGSAPDYPRLEISPTTGTVFASFIDYALGARCYVVGYEPGIETVRDPVVIPLTNSRGCRSLAVAPDGTVVVGGNAAGPLYAEVPPITGYAYWISRSADDGRTFSDPVEAFGYESIQAFEENEFGAATNRELAYDHSDREYSGRLYVASAEQNGSHADIVVRASDDHGRTWSEPIHIHDGSDHDQWLPNIAVAADGSVHVAFLDKHWDPDNRLVDVAWAHSSDGGKTWANARVTSVSFEGEKGETQSGAPSVGDYLGIDAVGDDVWLGFPEAASTDVSVTAVAKVVAKPESEPA